MTANHSPQSTLSAPELLAVSFAYPPLAYPRSVQVARLLKHIRFNTLLVCGDERDARRDETIEPDAEARLRACLRVPFSVDGWRKQAERIVSHLNPPLWNKIPDEYISWKPAAVKTINDFARRNHYKPDIIVSFGKPMSDHLIGLELKRAFRVPWVAHFSDPWVDNLFNSYDALTRKINIRLEQKVVEGADRLIFTSQETIDLIMARYAEVHRAKARVVPHSFDPSLYPLRLEDARTEITIRYIGEFYGKRTPKPLADTLRSILTTSPQLLNRVRFELVGPVNAEALRESGLENLPEGLVVTKPAVNYQDSLELAASSDGLLIVDAPAEQSVFLPSKLIDYIGAGRPILGLTPPGTAASVIEQLGGWVADPSDVQAMKRAMETFLSYLSQKSEKHSRVWGKPEVRKRYEASVVAERFEVILREVLT